MKTMEILQDPYVQSRMEYLASKDEKELLEDELAEKRVLSSLHDDFIKEFTGLILTDESKEYLEMVRKEREENT